MKFVLRSASFQFPARAWFIRGCHTVNGDGINPLLHPLLRGAGGAPVRRPARALSLTLGRRIEPAAPVLVILSPPRGRGSHAGARARHGACVAARAPQLSSPSGACCLSTAASPPLTGACSCRRRARPGALLACLCARSAAAAATPPRGAAAPGATHCGLQRPERPSGCQCRKPSSNPLTEVPSRFGGLWWGRTMRVTRRSARFTCEAPPRRGAREHY